MTDMLPGCDYPQRPQFFAIRFQTQLILTRAIDLIGIDAFALLVRISLAEDANYYGKPPTFWNGQLEDSLGGWSGDKLERVRRRAIHHGLLHYWRKNDRSVAFYWCLTPLWLEMPDESIIRTGAAQPAGGCAGGPAGGCAAPPTPIPNPQSLFPNTPPSPPSVDIPTVWVVVVNQMIEAGISDWQTPLRCLREHRALPDLALGVLRFASETGAWSGGKVRRRLMNLMPGQDPKNVKLWMPPDHPQRLPESVRSTSPAGRTASALQDRDRRLQQLELAFDSQVRGRTTKELVTEFDLPAALQERLRPYPTWSQIRNDDIRLAVLEVVAAHTAVHAN